MIVRRRFDAADKSVGAARRFVLGIIVDAPAEVRDSVALMVSELSTNSVVHASSGFDIGVDRSDRSVFVSVNDRGVGIPVLRSPESSEPHGRGLRIVDALADEWGISSAENEGNTVWFKISLHAAGLHSAAEAMAGVPQTDVDEPTDLSPIHPGSPTNWRRVPSSKLVSRHRAPARQLRYGSNSPSGQPNRVRSTNGLL